MENKLLEWLIDSDEPWTSYRTLVDLLNLSEEDPQVQLSRREMLEHPRVKSLISETGDWPGASLRRHNDAGHILSKLLTLADFGVKGNDPEMKTGLEAVLSQQSPEGAFLTLVNIPKAFGGTDEDAWTWILCDTPSLLYTLLAMGLGDRPEVQDAVNHLVGLVDENGWRCKAAAELGRFRGPGRKDDPCPIANVYALKALSLVTEMVDSLETRIGAEALLSHWERQKDRKIYMFGIGGDFRKLKYPFIWYDILHVVEVLSRYPFVHNDPRFQEMLKTILDQADDKGRFTASSMYMAWKGWSFADKKNPSPWLTFLVYRILKRIPDKAALKDKDSGSGKVLGAPHQGVYF